MKNILITGANGQLGNEMRVLSEENKEYTYFFTDVAELDICNGQAVMDFVKANHIQVIVNCAAYTAVDKAEENIEFCTKLNADAVGYLAKAAEANQAEFIQISTDYVFDGTAHTPYRETEPTCPNSVYGSTKLAGEQNALTLCSRAMVIRTAWLYSTFGNNFVKTMIRLGSEREDVSVVYDQVGTPTYATDLAEAIMHLVNKGIKGCEVYHYTNDGVASWFDFTKYIFKLAGCKANLHAIESYEYPTPAERPAYSVLSKRKIAEAGATVPYWTDSLEKCMKLLLAK